VKEGGRLEQVHSELADFAQAVADVPELRAVLRNPQVEPRAKAGVLEELLGDADKLLRNFLMLTAKKGRIADVEEIAREFEELVAREERRLDVELTKEELASRLAGFQPPPPAYRTSSRLRLPHLVISWEVTRAKNGAHQASCCGVILGRDILPRIVGHESGRDGADDRGRRHHRHP